MKVTPELRARIIQVHAKDPEISSAALGERFQMSRATISAILGPAPKPVVKPERPGPTLTAECACGWTFTGPKPQASRQRRAHYGKHPAGSLKARTTLRRAT